MILSACGTLPSVAAHNSSAAPSTTFSFQPQLQSNALNKDVFFGTTFSNEVKQRAIAKYTQYTPAQLAQLEQAKQSVFTIIANQINDEDSERGLPSPGVKRDNVYKWVKKEGLIQ